MPVWLVFLLSGIVIVGAGVRLARDGDAIAEQTGLGGLWVGAILVSAATSLPEVTTCISAVLQGAPSLAVGDLLGANMANLTVLALADLFTRHTRMLSRVTLNQLAVGTVAITVTSIALLGMLIPDWSFAGVGWAPLGIAVAYVAGMRHLHRNRPGPPFAAEATSAPSRPTRRAYRRAVIGFAAATGVILLSAPLLAWSGAALADQLGIGHGFAGMLLLALVTTLPETVVTIASVRAEAYDLAIGNLFGSNCFNMASLVLLDLVNGRPALLADLDPSLLIAGAVGLLLTSLAMLGVLDRAEHSRRGIEVAPLVMIAIYLAGLLLAYRAG